MDEICWRTLRWKPRPPVGPQKKPVQTAQVQRTSR